MTIFARPYSEWEPGKVGVFSGVPNDVYHKRTSGLGSSIASKLVFRSASHAKEALDNPKEPTSFMEMGTLVHCGTLEPARLASSYYVRPETRPAEKDCSAVKQGLAKPGDPIPWDNKAGYCKKWNEDHYDRPRLTVSEEKTLKGCIGALKANPTLAGMLQTGMSELSVFAKAGDVLLKCRPDLLATDGRGQLWDLDIKKCQDGSFFVFQNESRKARRDFQEAWYRFVLESAGIHVDHFVFAAVEEDPPHGVGIYRISSTNVEAMKPKVQEAIDKWFSACESDEWPGYHGEVQEIGWKP
jgi:hypothetical protein